MGVFDELNTTGNKAFEQLGSSENDINDFPSQFQKSTATSIFSFREDDSPIGNWQREGFYEGLVDFKKMFTFLISGVRNNGTTSLFDYEDYISTSVLKATAADQQKLFPTKDFLFFRDQETGINVPYEAKTPQGDKIALFPDKKLNKKLGLVHTTPDFRVLIDFKEEQAYFELGFVYAEDVGKRPPLKDYAILLRCKFYDQFTTILQLLNINVGGESNIQEEIDLRFNNAFKRAGGDPNILDWLYEKAPDFALVTRGAKQLINDLTSILKTFVDEIGTDEEKVVLKILKALAIINLKEGKGTNFIGKGADTLLNALLVHKVNKETLFERLYSKMNDKGFGATNFTNLIQFIYGIWYFSSWANQEMYSNDTATGPENIAYTNKKVLGFYQNGFDFNFENSKNGLQIKVTRTERTGGSIKAGTGDILTTVVGAYHPFQPIRMPEIPEKGAFKIDSTVIPAFYLKAFDDKAAWNNFEKGTWLAIDIITTFTGVGNLLKFRHLLKLRNVGGVSKVLLRLKFAASVVEVTSGALGAMLNFVESCDPGADPQENGQKSLCQHLREYLILVDLATLSVDAVVERLLKKKAGEALEAAEALAKNAENSDDLEDIIEHLENFSGTIRESVIGTGGFLKYSKILSRKVFGQEDSLSCAIACIRQLAKDQKIVLTENQVRKFGEIIKGFPTYEGEMTKASLEIFKGKKFGEGILEHIPISTKEISSILGNNNSWVAWVKNSRNDSISHAIIVDKIEDGLVKVRDPWPIEGIEGVKSGKPGVEAVLTIDEFEKIWSASNKYAFWFKN
ncbi:hypothetical protein [Aquimarina sp. 2201CG14-23]|uniref:hypothetical protein n=1 Tax=Aquimarina mycalae TaxID=3040073 RepID=UPI002477DC51|nr:hypothetical protein [Aquimarina sp. 2201CG14-23]MDH7447095.1 hypothetical protein [Aquimarina sp. 2201CG14-23]